MTPDPIDTLIMDAWMHGTFGKPFPETSRRQLGEPYISDLQKHLGIQFRAYIKAHGGLRNPPKDQEQAA